jgi:flagellar motor protein MotB
MTSEYQMSQADSHGDEGEESYFVSMTDIMVGMLFVFIILLMYFVFRIQTTSEPMVPVSEHQAVVLERDKSLSRVKDLEEEVARLNKNPLERYLKLADAARGTILNDLKMSMADVKGIKEGDVKIIPEQGILRLSGDVLFPKGVSTISPGTPSDNAIKVLAAALNKVLPCFSLGPAGNAIKSCNPNAAFIDTIFIEGHTDDSPITGVLEGSITDNLSLSARRAINTMQAVYLHQPQLKLMWSISPSQEGKQLGEGVSPLINAAAFGDTRPVVPNDTEDGKKSNRRIDLRVLMFSPRTENLDSVRQLLAQ